MAILSDEEAKAAQEVAKLGQKGLENLSEAGKYLTGTFKGTIGFLAAAAQDSAEGYYWRNRAAVLVKTNARLRELEVEDKFEPIGERSKGLLLDAISHEDNEEIQDVWAAYVSNSMDPNQPDVSIDRILIDVIRNLEPTDFPVLKRLSYENLAMKRRKEIRLTESDFPVPDDHLIVSLSRLAAIGLFTFENSGSVGFAASEGWEKPCQLEVHTSLGAFRAMPLLLLFQRYVRSQDMSPEAPDASEIF